MPSEVSRFLPVARRELMPALLKAREDDAHFHEAASLLDATLRFQSHDRAERLRAAYAPFDPDPLIDQGAPGDDKRFLDALEDVLEEANFEPVSREQLVAAFEEKSLFPLLAQVDLSEYEILRLHARGTSHRRERIRSWRTLWRWKEIELELYERLVVVLRMRAEALDGDKTFGTLGMQPDRIYLKSFKNVPRADVEMVLPNTRLRLRPRDRALVGVPLVGGVLYTLYQSIGVVLAVTSGAVALSLDDPRLRAIGGVLLVLGGYLWRSHAKVKTTRLEYLKTLSEGLYFRNLANNGAVLDQLVCMADDEEAKEAILAYHFLSRDGPMTAEALDEAAEAWVREKTRRTADFDVHDGLACLEGLELAHKEDDRWHALAPMEAARLLDERWDRAFEPGPPAPTP